MHFCFRGRLALQILQTDLFSPTGTVYSYHGSRTPILSLLLYVLLDYALLCSYMTLHKLPFQHQIHVVFYVRNNADIRINITRKHHQILEHFEKFEMTSNMAAVAMMYLRFLSVVHWITLRWRHNERDCVSNHKPHDFFYSAVYSGTDQRKYQSSASLAFVRGIHRGPANSSHKGTVTRKILPFDDVIMHKQNLTAHSYRLSAKVRN